MADDDAASSARSRVPQGRRLPKQRPQRPERPAVALARNLIEAEYGLRAPQRGGGGAGSAETEDIWAQLTDELRRLIDRLRGRSPSPSAGPIPSTAGGQEPGSFDGSVPQPPPPSGQSAQAGREGFEEMVGRLPRHEREAFEDAVLELVRSDEKWTEAYDRSPASMPSVAEYANNAYMRESLRERWEREAPSAQPSVAPSSRSGFAYPGQNEMIDGHAFLSARTTEQLRSDNPPPVAPARPVSPEPADWPLARDVPSLIGPEGHALLQQQRRAPVSGSVAPDAASSTGRARPVPRNRTTNGRTGAGR